MDEFVYQKKQNDLRGRDGDEEACEEGGEFCLLLLLLLLLLLVIIILVIIIFVVVTVLLARGVARAAWKGSAGCNDGRGPRCSAREQAPQGRQKT
jgi:flagellar basal body-associated protein FliL